MTPTRTLARALALATSLAASPLFAACPANAAKPFTSGPLDALGMFSAWVVDSNGVGLQACTDSVTHDGNPPPCFYDPPVPGNALSQALGRGGEAFLFLADNVITTTGRYPIDLVIVQGVETAFLSAEPLAGFQTQFQRLRTRVNVAATGFYTVETPWSNKTYKVDTLLKPGNGQNRAEISEPIDISFAAASSVPGLVSPFLVSDPPPAGFAGYIGDGLTPTQVSGSPCGQNFVRVTAVALDGVTPIDINNGSNVVVNPFFTVSGKLAPVSATPLSIGAAYYSRDGSGTSVSVLAEGSLSASASASSVVTVNGSSLAMARDRSHWFVNVPITGALPATVSVTATDLGKGTMPNTLSAPVSDLVTISRAEARCSAGSATCLLTVDASSSDNGSGPDGAPVLTLLHNAQVISQGRFSAAVPKALPGRVSVSSSRGGVSTRALTIINQ
jgi:hypothetical protein